MKLTIFFLFAFQTLSLLGQDWKPIHKGRVNNYLVNQDKNSVRSIWVDSSNVVNSETVYYLNRVYKYPVYGMFSEYICRPCAVINQPEFLLRSIRESPNGYVFEDGSKNTFIIKTSADLHDTWNFDADRTATVTDISLGQIIINASDSLKTISLSTGEKIVLSKKFGIISFPAFGTKSQYILTGFEGPTMGLQMPTWKSIYSFGIGDRFEYHGKNLSVGGRNDYTYIDQYLIEDRTDKGWQMI